MRLAVAGVCCVLICCSASALGPHEILVLVNVNSRDSELVATEFCRLRCVPTNNVIRLSLPQSWGEAPATISNEDFTRLIFLPACELVRQRGIDDHILAWVYSCGFPYRVTTDPPVSITGLTFLRNRLPSAKDIAEGRYASPLFAGPVAPQTWPYLSQTFDCYREWLHDEMPLPAMMLGYTGQRGNTAAEIVECLRKGVRSNYTAPTGTIYLVTNNDIRSTCRAWQYPATVRELASMGIRAFVTSELPTDDRGIIGLMIGAATVEPEGIKSYLPGCMAEHLTSGAAIFDAREQTKVSAWIRAGVTASAGTVTEPLSIWTKFPHARFFVHYAAGCTMIESFYQAVRCPLQLLLVGDPLATPWAPRGKLAVEGMTEEPLHGIVILKAEGETESGQIFSRFVYLLDGRVVGKGRSLKLDTTRFGNGRHRLRVVAHTRGLVRHQAFLEKEILIKNL